jgi:hypothetical protein
VKGFDSTDKETPVPSGSYGAVDQRMGGVLPGDARRYRIIGVLGRGGFGVVYKARMEGPEGFVKDVAIKILTVQDPNAETIARFRDEARILGRLHDRAIVGVDPPVRLDNRWALVMDYVEGADCRRLLKEHVQLPPTVAFEIVQEVARALDTLWSYRGDANEPLRLLHRDLKPGNLQITQYGTVKVLDFGVARAEFDNREMMTTNNIGGTIGYIAPERLQGIDGPAGDVWSLGVVLEELVSGRRTAIGGDDEDDPASGVPITPAYAAAIDLARRMRATSPADRPDAAEVEEECRHLARSHLGPTLREWARTHVGGTFEPSDEMVGQTLSEVFARSAPNAGGGMQDERGLRRILAGILLFLGSTGLLVVAAVGLLVVGLLVWWRTSRPELEVADIPVAEPVPVVDPSPVPVPMPVPAPSVAAPAPEPAPAPKPKPTTVKPAPAPAPAPSPVPAPPAPVTGRVIVEGATSVQLVGPSATYPAGRVPPGTYTIQAVFGEDAPVNAGTVTVEAGDTVSLSCNARFKRCKVR